MNRERLSDLTLCVWFIVVAVSFFGPYLGILGVPDLTAVYGAFLLLTVAALALRLLRGGGGGDDDGGNGGGGGGNGGGGKRLDSDASPRRVPIRVRPSSPPEQERKKRRG